MKHISALLIFVILSGLFPANFALASEDGGASVWTQIGDLFRSEKTQSNVEELSGVGGEKEAEQPKLSLTDRISSWWDGFSVKEIFSGADDQSIQDAVAPLPVAPNPFTQKVQPTPKAVESVSSEKSPISDSASVERGYFGSLAESILKTQIFAVPVTAAFSYYLGAAKVSTLTTGAAISGGWVYYPGELIVAAGTGATALVWGAVSIVTGAGIYFGSRARAWPFTENNPRIAEFGDNFRKAADKSIISPLSDLYNSIVPERKEAPTLTDKLIESGTYQPGGPAPVAKPVVAPIVPVTENVPEPSYPDTAIIGNSINISGFLNLTYYNCGGSGNLGPYQDDWIAKLYRKADTPDLIYSGSVEVVDFMSVGEITVKWDDLKNKWTVSMSSPLFTTSSLSVNFDENLSQGKTSGNVSIKTSALGQLGFGSCGSGAGNFSGLIVR